VIVHGSCHPNDAPPPNSIDRGKASVAKRSQAQRAPVKTEVVDRYLNRLRNAGLRTAEFESVISELQADKSAKKAEVLAIAFKYAGPTPLRSRAAAIEAVRKKFVQIVRVEQELEIASKMTPS
jgi:hypothetical protein